MLWFSQEKLSTPRTGQCIISAEGQAAFVDMVLHHEDYTVHVDQDHNVCFRGGRSGTKAKTFTTIPQAILDQFQDEFPPDVSLYLKANVTPGTTTITPETEVYLFTDQVFRFGYLILSWNPGHDGFVVNRRIKRGSHRL